MAGSYSPNEIKTSERDCQDNVLGLCAHVLGEKTQGVSGWDSSE